MKHCPAYEYHVESRTYRPHRPCANCMQLPPLDPKLVMELERQLARALA